MTDEKEQKNNASEETDNGVAPVEHNGAENNHIAKRRGRMVAAGVIATVALCVIAVAVAAIFNFTVNWFNQCPEDVAVNDPAPVLWNKVVARKSIDADKGLPENLKKYGSMKGASETE